MRPPRPPCSRTKSLIAHTLVAPALVAPALVATALLAGCAGTPPAAQRAAGPAPLAYAIDLAGGAAVCKPGAVTPKSGKTVAATMTLGNDGGWCGLPVSRNGAPYAAGLLTRRAAHGRVYIHSVGAVTRIDYTPDAGFVGRDGFAVTLLEGGSGASHDARLKVTLTVRR